MLAQIRSTTAFSSGTKRCSDGLYRTLIPRVKRPADAQFRSISNCAQGRADVFESGCSMSEQGGPCPLPQMAGSSPEYIVDYIGSMSDFFNDFPFWRGSVLRGVGP